MLFPPSGKPTMACSPVSLVGLMEERCVYSSQRSGFDSRSSLNFSGSFSMAYVVYSTARIISTFTYKLYLGLVDNTATLNSMTTSE